MSEPSPLASGFAAAFAADPVLAGDAERAAALARFAAAGLPTRRDERWRYTDLAPLVRRRFEPAAPAHPARDPVPDLPALRVPVAAGRATLPTSIPAGLSLRPWSDLDAAARSAWALPPEADALVALNTALARDGLVIEVAPGARIALPLLLLQHTTGDGASSHPRLCIRLGADAELMCVDHLGADGGTLVNAVTQVRLAAGARLDLVRVQDQAPDSHHLGTTFADLDAEARLTLGMHQIGARIGRQAVEARLRGAGAHLSTRALNLGGGRQQLDLRVAVEHHADRTGSEQVYRGVATGHARIAGVSRVLVAAATRGADAAQDLRSLLLSPHAEADQKPELEIHAHEVAARHGATIGHLDPDALFYLRSRGLDRASAEALLVFAFADEALVGLPAPLRRHLEARLRDGLPGAPAA